MKTIRCFITLFFASFFLISGLQAQQDSCYVRLEDASGYTPTAEQLAKLEAAAAELCAVFDSAGFSGQFKVYDFGFYLHQEVTEGGYPEPFVKKIQEVQGVSPYYLLFGKQTDRSGVYTRFWVDLKLPDSLQFSCLTGIQRELYKKRVEDVVIEKYKGNNNSFSFYHAAKISGMLEVERFIEEIKDCCVNKNRNISIGCDGCSREFITTYFQYKKYSSVDIIASTSSQANINNGLIIDISDVKLNGEYIGDVLQNISYKVNSYVPFKILVTSNSNYCSMTLEEIQTLRSNVGFDCHINLSYDLIDSSKSNLQIDIKSFGTGFSEKKNRGIEFILYCFVLKQLSIGEVIFNGDDALVDAIEKYFLPPDPTPENISTTYYLYQNPTDMDNAPDSSPKNALGVKRNAEYHFKQRLINEPHMWSELNKQRIKGELTGNFEPPVVDSKWLEYNPNHTLFEYVTNPDGTFQYDQNGNKIRQPLRHHHHEHGKYAYSIPEGLHKKYSKYLHFLTRQSKSWTLNEKIDHIREKIDKLNRGLGTVNLFLNVYSIFGGLFTGDPGNIVNWFGPVTIGKLKYNVSNDNYMLFFNECTWKCNSNRTGYHSTWKSYASFIVYGYYAFDETTGEWVGLAPIATGYVVKDCDGNVDVTIDGCWAYDCPPSFRS